MVILMLYRSQVLVLSLLGVGSVLEKRVLVASL